ncbi:MAG: glycoside hydrolase family 13 protein [Clostridia bacterium]
MLETIYNPIDKEFRSEIGGAALFAPQFFRIKILRIVNPIGLHFCITPEGKNTFKLLMNKIGEDGLYDIFETEYTPCSACLQWYYFSYWNGEKTVLVGKDVFGSAKISDYPFPWQLTVYRKEETPDWFKGGVMYQIFTDRFNRAGEIKVRDGAVFHHNWKDTPNYKAVNKKILNNDFFGGNFQGVIEKLDYLKSLGVNIIYFNPIFEAESNHKYDTCDFSKIDTAFGGEEKFKELIEKCNERGIKIILDGVFNHVGMESKYFNRSGKYNTVGAYQSKTSEYYDWFTFTKYPTKYDSWWGIELLPAINETSQSYVDYICGENGIVDKYMKMGIGGFRLDVVDELPDEFLNKLTERVRLNNKDGIIIGEVWEDASNKIAYEKRRKYFVDNQIDGVMNYPWKNAIIYFMKTGSSQYLYSEIVEILNNYPKKNIDYLMNILGTHDTLRILTALAGRERENRTREDIANWKMSADEIQKGIKLLKLASVLQFTLPGVPSIYYGDEAGVEGYQDPFNRTTYPWGEENQELIDWFKRLGAIRRDECYKLGEMTMLPYVENVIGYFRESENSKELIVVNMSNKPFILKTESFDLLTNSNITKVNSQSACICKIK